MKLIGCGEGDYWTLVRMRFSSNVLAELTVVPLMLTWADVPASRRLRDAPPRRYLEIAAVFVGLLGASLVAFDLPLFDANAAPALFYAPLPFLLWAAVRLGPVGTASALALMVTVTIWGAVNGLGPFAGGSPQDTARDMQLFLIAVSVPLLLLAVALEERSARASATRTSSACSSRTCRRVAMLGELSGGIAHELNQPLTAILSNAQAAQHFIASKGAIDQEELAEILSDIIAADQRAGEVIRRLRALFKRGETQLQPLDAERAGARGARHRARRPGDARASRCVTELARGLPLIQGDRVQLEQVMLNLVMNACEAMSAGARRRPPPHHPHPRAATAACRSASPTSARASAPRTTRSCSSRSTPPSRRAWASGLSISRSIITAHGGRLWGTVEPGHGATFPHRPPGIGPWSNYCRRAATCSNRARAVRRDRG